MYHTGVGVVAHGISTDGYKETAYEDDQNEEYYVPLDFHWALADESQWDEKAPKAWEMNKKWNSSHRFRQTVWSITQEMANGIDSLSEEKGLNRALRQE